MTTPAFRMRPLGLTDVTIDDRFWRPRIETNRSVTVPIEYQQCRKTRRIQALKLGWKPGMPNPPHHFWDSDIAKWIEAAAYCLAATPDKKLERQVE